MKVCDKIPNYPYYRTQKWGDSTSTIVDVTLRMECITKPSSLHYILFCETFCKVLYFYTS